KVYESISQMLPNQIQVQTSLLNNVQFISDPLPTIEADVFTKLFEAIRQHKTISFGYRSIHSLEHTPHSLDPYKIYCQKGDWYVIGFCHSHKKYSTYNLSRMKDIVLLDEFEVDREYDSKVHIDPNFGIWNNEASVMKIELIFDKSVNTYILERTWHKNQKCYQDEDGSVHLSFESNQLQETLYWVLHFGSAVKIENPPELKELYKAEVKKMMKNI
ncbi:MAG: WYL domain-containing protein, partial [Treponema sp.]|nr:WYL domain-containing protein [Treponema sp.]